MVYGVTVLLNHYFDDELEEGAALRSPAGCDDRLNAY